MSRRACQNPACGRPFVSEFWWPGIPFLDVRWLTAVLPRPAIRLDPDVPPFEPRPPNIETCLRHPCRDWAIRRALELARPPT